MEHQGCRQLYNEQRKKYVELKKKFIALKSSYLKLKESHENSLQELENARKEVEGLKALKGMRRRSGRLRETIQDSVHEEQYSHFLLKTTFKPQGSGKVDQVNPDQSIYMDGNESWVYQGFFIVGPKGEDVGVADPLVPEILFEYYPANTTIGQNIKSIIPTLCFPTSIFIEKNTKIGSPTQRTIQNVINNFVVTVKNENLATRVSPLPNWDHELLYVTCITFEETVTNKTISWIVPKCYCIASFIPAFDLHFSVLNQMLKLATQKPRLRLYDAICENEELLLEFFKECEDLKPSKMIQFGVETCGFIRYKCPKQLNDIDAKWTVPTLVRNLISDDFLWTLFAISQEKSIVFVSANPSLASSCVLALHSLLRPLKWPNLMIPLIPNTLSELLEAPIPILAGVPYINLNKRKELNTIIWVMLDEKNISKRIIKYSNDESEVILPCWPEGIRKIKGLYPTLQDKREEESQEELENCFEIKKVVSELWSCIIAGQATGGYLDFGEDFLDAVCNTQMFSVTVGD